jgi:putative transposase
MTYHDAERRATMRPNAMSDDFEIGYFDPDSGLEQSQRCLPHWFQPNVATFITFRTIDSMPKAIVKRWHEELANWLREHGISLSADGRMPDWNLLPDEVRSTFLQHRNYRWHWHLDSCQESAN